MAESSFGAMATGGEGSEYSFVAPQAQAPRSPLSPSDGSDQIDRTVSIGGIPIDPRGKPFPSPSQYLGMRLKQEAPDLLGMLATLLIPGGLATRRVLGPLSRIGAGSLVAGGTKTAQTQDIGEGLEAAGRFGISQGIGESLGTIGTSLYDFLKTGKLGAAALKQHEAALAERATQETARKQRIAQQEADYRQQVNARQAELATVQEQERLRRVERANQAVQQKQAYQQTVQAQETQYTASAAAHAERQIAAIADHVKSQVPVFKDLPSTSEGAWQMAFGTPTLEVNKAFDAALQRSLPKPGMQSIELWIEDAKNLKLVPAQSGSTQLGSKISISVDARDAAKAVVGKWTDNPGLYRRVVRALDEANVGDPASRAMYRSAQAFIKFADKSQMFDAAHVFHPEKAQVALGKLAANREILRRKELGLFGQIEAAKPLAPPSPIPELSPIPLPPPLARPQPIPKPILPPDLPAISPSPVTKSETSVGHALGLLLGLYGGHLIGHPYIGAGVGAALGGKFGPTIPSYRGVMQPPLGPLGQGLRRVGPTALGAGARATWDYILQDDFPPGPLKPQLSVPRPEPEPPK